jgi:hypothetical protein
MLNKLLTLSLLFIISFPVYSESFVFTCISNKDHFTITYEVNTDSKTIFQLSSFNPINGQRYKTNKFNKIIKWEYPLVFSYSSSLTDGFPTFKIFNFNELTKSSSSHYVDQDPFSQFFRCSRS